ncbi:hypothetical protein OSB04_027759 [Centaurea solstitialis]|uniref:Uncharacterized protein n=1 Tax=Centaurea solstitialis TaxID=347529 RepID=A0AA38SZC5_9ASTR|nr:hypothetical protein OSB04_027759 [Centaurea solstitialis]
MKKDAKIPYLKYPGAKVPIQSDTCGTLAVTLARVLMGPSWWRFHVLDEAERSLHDMLCLLTQAVNYGRDLSGGG